jgi:N-acetylneuraminate synthase
MPRTYIIAEAGVNHNGSTAHAIQLVEAAARAGADAVKFQTFSADRLVRQGTATAAYQRSATGNNDQFDLLRRLEMSPAMHDAILAACARIGIEFLSTPFDPLAADYLLGLGMRKLKVPSGELSNPLFVRHLAATGLPLIISTGMADLAEVATALAWVRAARAERGLSGDLAGAVTLLHCTSNYPTAPENVNLRAMETLRREFGVPVGYSDHTEGITIPIAAVALGATVIEKHFTLDRTLPGPDHQASLEPADLEAMVRAIRTVDVALGGGQKVPATSEAAVRALVRRSLFLRRDVAAGTELGPDDLELLRPGDGIPASDYFAILGRRLARARPGGHKLSFEDLLP